MTLKDLFEVDKGVIKKVKLGGKEFDTISFLIANISMGGFIFARDYEVKKIYLPETGSGIVVEVEINIKKED